MKWILVGISIVCGAASDLLDPDILNAVDVRGEVVVGDDHLHVLEGGVVPVSGAVEVGLEDGCMSVGHSGLLRLGCPTGALEACALE